MRCTILGLPLVAACAFGSGPVSGGGGAGGGSGGGSGGGNVGSGSATPDAACPSVSFQAHVTTPSIQILIDRSLSMGYTLDTSANISRYQAVGSAVLQVVGSLQSKVYFGASLFTQTSTACPRIDSTPARQLNNLSQVQTLIQNFSPDGFTPTAAALAQTAQRFQNNPPPADSPAIIVFATDGLPNNCQPVGDPWADTIGAISDAYSANIRTFVLGIAGVDESYLQEMANAGQGVTANQHQAAYFTASNASALDAAVETIIGTVASCDLAISGQVDPQLASSGIVTLDGVTLHYQTEWHLLDDHTLELEGAACNTLKTDPNAHVEATFPCNAIIY